MHIIYIYICTGGAVRGAVTRTPEDVDCRTRPAPPGQHTYQPTAHKKKIYMYTYL